MASQENKFELNRILTTTGSLGNFQLNESNDFIRFVVENANGGNTIVVKAGLNGQDESNFTTVLTLSGSDNKIVTVNNYEVININCTVLDGTNIKIIGSGFKN